MHDQVVHIPETFKLEHLAISSVTGEPPSSGDGPVDAAYKAVDQITTFEITHGDYSVHSVTKGQEAMGEAIVKVRDHGYHDHRPRSHH